MIGVAKPRRERAWDAWYSSVERVGVMRTLELCWVGQRDRDKTYLMLLTGSVSFGYNCWQASILDPCWAAHIFPAHKQAYAVFGCMIVVSLCRGY